MLIKDMLKFSSPIDPKALLAEQSTFSTKVLRMEIATVFSYDA